MIRTRNESVIRHLTPTALALLSVELEAANRNAREDDFLDDVNAALTAICGEEEAEQHRQWCRDNI